MRYLSTWLWGIATGLLILSACSKDETSESFSDLGVEKDKQNIENEGLALIDDLRALANTPFSLTCFEAYKILKEQPASKQHQLFNKIIQMGVDMQDEKSTDEQFTNLKTIATNQSGIFSSLWNEELGTWEWNPEIQEFTKTSTQTDTIIYRFPATTDTRKNNAEIRLYGLKVYDGNFPGKGEIMEDGTVINEMIQELYFAMKVDEELVATSNIINYISSDGHFENIAVTFNPLPFSFVLDLVTENDLANWLFKVSNDKEVILKHSLKAIANSNLYDDSPVKSLETTLQIKGIVATGNINADQLFPVINQVEQKLESNPNLSDEEVKAELEKIVNTLNQHADFQLKYSDGDIIAKAQALVMPHEDEWRAVNWKIGMVLEFSDGSRIDIESFFEQNFDRFMNEMQIFIQAMEERMLPAA